MPVANTMKYNELMNDKQLYLFTLENYRKIYSFKILLNEILWILALVYYVYYVTEYYSAIKKD